LSNWLIGNIIGSYLITVQCSFETARADMPSGWYGSWWRLPPRD